MSIWKLDGGGDGYDCPESVVSTGEPEGIKAKNHAPSRSTDEGGDNFR